MRSFLANKKNTRGAALYAALLCFAKAFAPDFEPAFARAEETANPYRVVSSSPDKLLTGRFKQLAHQQNKSRTARISPAAFTGGDAAYSIKLSDKRALWLFGDSFFGPRKDGCIMDRNSLALDNPRQLGLLPTFFPKRPAFFGVPGVPNNFFWPGDGVLLDGKLYVFMHETENAPNNPAGFNFNPLTDHLLTVENPLAEPRSWKIKDFRLGNRASQRQIGIACLIDGNYLYVYSTNSACGVGFNKNPTALARLALSDLKTGHIDRMQWLGDTWQDKAEFLKTLWEDGASEMTVTRINGLSGYFAFYIPFGNKGIMMRHAVRPEGPWSAALNVYPFPKVKSDISFYSAKAHPEYALKAGEIELTYCNNSSMVSQLFKNQDLYYPEFVKVQLQAVKHAP